MLFIRIVSALDVDGGLTPTSLHTQFLRPC
jgi:hypothetical protein